MFFLNKMRSDIERAGGIWKRGAKGQEQTIERANRAVVSIDGPLYGGYVEDKSGVAEQFRVLTRKHDVQAIWILENDGVVNAAAPRKYLIKNTIRQGIPLLAPVETLKVRPGVPINTGALAPNRSSQVCSMGRLDSGIWSALPIGGSAVAVWGIAVASGAVLLTSAQNAPGAPAQWAADSQVKLASQKATLLVFVHSHCPCTDASMEELARLMRHPQADEVAAEGIQQIAETVDGMQTRPERLGRLVGHFDLEQGAAGEPRELAHSLQYESGKSGPSSGPKEHGLPEGQLSLGEGPPNSGRIPRC